MSKYRNNLPQLTDQPFLTDGGLETTLIYHNGFELPEFAAFDLLKDENGITTLTDYYRRYTQIAKQNKVGFILESATWRSNPDWAIKLGYSSNELDQANEKAIEMLNDLRTEYEDQNTKIVISGCIGPRGDGYNPVGMMTSFQAEKYHQRQIDVFKTTAADLITAITMTYSDEAIGVTLAAKNANMPVVISFTLETDGKLPSGQSLKDAIEQVDKETGGYPVYFMINCAHPTHFAHIFEEQGNWVERIKGVRANASCKSHAELDESTELDAGNPVELSDQYVELKQKLPALNVLGGCCGTDHTHIQEIVKAHIN